MVCPPDQVLFGSRHGTCLDLALVLARLRDTADAGGNRDGQVETGDGRWSTPPVNLLPHQLQTTVGGSPRQYLAIDPVGFATALLTTAAPGVGVGFDAAVVNAARYLIQPAAGAGSGATSGVSSGGGVDLGTGWA